MVVSTRRIGRAASQRCSPVTASAPSRSQARAGASVSSSGASLVVGPNSLTYRTILSGTPTLPSNPLSVPNGATVLAWVAMGDLASMVAPTDSKGNTYSSVLPPRAYFNWAGSGQQLWKSANVAGDSALVVSESMVPSDEVTLSVLVVQGGSVVGPAVGETPSTGPVIAPSVTVSGPAILVSSWWGDGGFAPESVVPSIPVGEANSGDGAGWVLLHDMSFPFQNTGLIQTALAVRQVSLAGTYACTWTATEVGGGSGQGGIAYTLAVA